MKNIIFPPDTKCLVCGRDIRAGGRVLCDACELEENGEPVCARCGRSMDNAADYCETCKAGPHSFDVARSVFRFEGRARALMLGFKFGGECWLGGIFARFLAEIYQKMSMETDIVVAVPSAPDRVRERGYDHVAILADGLSAHINVDVCKFLYKTASTPPSYARGKAERLVQIKGTIGSDARINIKGKRILLIDDILTTCATADECARILKRCGAPEVAVLTVAAVPQRAFLY
ncbi:MAG: ComF family protein [Firmicutes bacterium]|nr:ComF family protein [Bacillota bacterium]